MSPDPMAACSTVPILTATTAPASAPTSPSRKPSGSSETGHRTDVGSFMPPPKNQYRF